MKDFVYFDLDTSSWPYALAFFMFRAGAHNEAVEYLLSPSNSQEVKDFGSLYGRYLKDLGTSASLDDVAGFLNDYNMYLESSISKDMYRDALVNLMTGNSYSLINETVFWENLIPHELETQLWYKLKLAGFERRESHSMVYVPQRVPSNYKGYNLLELHDYILDLGRPHFVGVSEDGKSDP